MVVMINKNEVCVVNDTEVSTYQNKGYETLVTDMGFRKHPEYVEWDVFNHMDTVYPLTIKADRYSGVYSGGAYTAWPCDEAEIPSEVFTFRSWRIRWTACMVASAAVVSAEIVMASGSKIRSFLSMP